ncbi:MAG: hypothetical protein HY985_09530 [Magnetospirillum sp.]|nr:hypothetical protein [Magnetospirillum sp.]
MRAIWQGTTKGLAGWLVARRSTAVALASVVLSGLVSGCAIPPALTVASYVGDGILMLATGKSSNDHALSLFTGKDCATMRVLEEKDICFDPVLATAEPMPAEVLRDEAAAQRQLAAVGNDDAQRQAQAGRAMDAAFQPLASGERLYGGSRSGGLVLAALPRPATATTQIAFRSERIPAGGIAVASAARVRVAALAAAEARPLVKRAPVRPAPVVAAAAAKTQIAAQRGTKRLAATGKGRKAYAAAKGRKAYAAANARKQYAAAKGGKRYSAAKGGKRYAADTGRKVRAAAKAKARYATVTGKKRVVTRNRHLAAKAWTLSAASVASRVAVAPAGAASTAVAAVVPVQPHGPAGGQAGLLPHAQAPPAQVAELPR